MFTVLTNKKYDFIRVKVTNEGNHSQPDEYQSKSSNYVVVRFYDKL